MAYSKIYSRIIWQNQPSTATAVGATNLNKIDYAANELDNRVVALDTAKAEQSVVNSLVQSITYNSSNGVLTITKVNGTTASIDTKLEKLAVNFSYNSSTQKLIITMDDGTTQNVDLSALITQYEFSNSSTVAFTITNGVITAIVPDGSITAAKLQPNYLATVTVQAQTATAQASQAKRYAVGGVESGDTTDNAKYYKEQAQAAAASAQQIAGFDPTTKLDKTGDSKSNTVTFTQASSLANIATGETHATLFGKVSKFFAFVGTTALNTLDKTVSGAINELKTLISKYDVLTTKGDIIVYNTAPSRLPKGSFGQFLGMNSDTSLPQWKDIPIQSNDVIIRNQLKTMLLFAGIKSFVNTWSDTLEDISGINTALSSGYVFDSTNKNIKYAKRGGIFLREGHHVVMALENGSGK